MKNALTIDVEDYYMVSAFADRIRFEDWPRHESRVSRSTGLILDLLEEFGVAATFFVLGWVAEQCPGLVRSIQDRGHEVACHGYNHRLIYHLSPEEFREDTRRAKTGIEDLIGCEVIGYRATSFSVVDSTLWALDILAEEGFRYDSSIFPVHHDRYGLSSAGRFSQMMMREGCNILEIPPSTLNFMGKNVPIAGGGYLRLYPTRLTEWGVRQINERESQPVIVYVHPWEVDPGQPRMQGSRRSVFRHYVNMDTTVDKLRYLLDRFSFGPMREVFADGIARAGNAVVKASSSDPEAGTKAGRVERACGAPSCAA